MVGGLSLNRSTCQEPWGSCHFTPLRGQGSTTTPIPNRKERKQVLQLLFIDIQVGSIATSLEAAAVVGEMEDGGVECLSAATAG